MAPSVIVLGASGNVGSFIIAELLKQKPKFNRIAILAAPEKAEKFSVSKFKGIEIVIGSFLDSASFTGFDIVVSLLGSAALEKQPAIADAAIKAGATHFYPSEFGVDIGLPIFANERYFTEKLVTRKHLADLVSKNSEFGYTLLMIGLVTEFVVVTPLFGVDKEKKEVDFIGEGSTKLTFTAFPDIARYLVASLLSAAPRERQLRVTGETTTAAKVFSTLSAVQDIPYKVGYSPVSKAKDMEEHFDKEGNAYLAAIFNLRYALSTRGYFDENDDEKFDFKPETVEETFKRLTQ